MGESPRSANKKGPKVGLNGTRGGVTERVGRSGEMEERGFEGVDAAEERGKQRMGLLLLLLMFLQEAWSLWVVIVVGNVGFGEGRVEVRPRRLNQLCSNGFNKWVSLC